MFGGQPLRNKDPFPKRQGILDCVQLYKQEELFDLFLSVNDVSVVVFCLIFSLLKQNGSQQVVDSCELVVARERMQFLLKCSTSNC